MPANTAPIALLVPLTGFATLTAAQVATDGTGGNVATLLTIGGNGGRLDRIRLVPLGTNIATKAYVFLNNGASQAVATNNALLLDLALLASTASDVNQIGAPLDLVLGFVLPPGTVVLVSLATAVAAGWKILAFGGSY